ncbi:tRNA lysidine(34) synthetase TilS [Aliidiomarina celeris]|uniref:tRNA lysidine(34) synthetase TilS n=1 Tax=Aliidiomarina celeris TaxID=2249428 RepID=UPI000DEB2D39|nr:tRNA lysidine(34) synthetase TilS [Aliidiomarina celeris]
MATADLYPQFKQQLCALALATNQQIVVALGGGVDSQTVLDLTDRFRREFPNYRYLAIHLDHAFHEKSAAWAEFLRADCEQRQFPAIIEPIQVVIANRESKEAAGREARYQRLAELTEANAVILLGQHRSDQIETFLLQLQRGAGPKGLSSMAAIAPFKEQRRLLRLLLNFEKTELYAYAEAHGVQWIEDDTNYDTSIDRNFLRHEIVPRLQQRWPSIQATVARSAELCAEQQSLLEYFIDKELTPRIQGDRFELAGWLELAPNLQKALLRRWFERAGVPLPSSAIMTELLRQLSRLPQGKVRVQWGQNQVYRERRQLVLAPL